MEHDGKEEGPQEHDRSRQARDRDRVGEGAEKGSGDTSRGDSPLGSPPHPPTPPIS